MALPLPSPEPQTLRYSIDGMTCAACAARIERVLAKDHRNVQVTVNFPAKSATVTSNQEPAAVQAAIEGLGYGAQLRPDAAALAAKEAALARTARNQLVLAVALALPVMTLGMLMLASRLSGMIQLVLTTAVLLGPGRGFFTRAMAQARHGQLGMDALVAMGSAAAYGFSVYLLALGHAHLYFESAAVIVALILVGKYLEERARQHIAAAVRALLKLQPSEAYLLSHAGTSDEAAQRIAVTSLGHGALILVKPGDRFPVDGVVRRGTSAVDAAMLTGESLPVDVAVDSIVAAGTENLTGPLVVETTGTGAETELAKIVELVEAAQGTKAPIQNIADQVAGWFVPAAVLIAVATLIGWLLVGADREFALTAAVSVLVVACPCALGLATPTAVMAGTGKAARRGILVKDAAALQTLHKATAMVFDKTGTLTEGRPTVTACELEGTAAEAEVLSWAKALEAGSSHPLAQAIVRYAEEQGITAAALVDVQETAGSGVRAKLANDPAASLCIGSYTGPQDDDLGETYVALSKNEQLVAVFKLRDTLRPEAKASVEALRQLGIKPVMATGDGTGAARLVANSLGGIEMHARQTPAQKAALVQALRQAGHVVAMAGDGINDAPALAAADVGLAMGSGTDAAIAAAGITLKDSSITKIVEAVRLSRLTFRNIKENLFWAFAYNIVLIPAAALGYLSPMAAAAAMSLSSLFVVGNALRLKMQV